jgi:protein-L-isoaspartate(D-aspartate) O-methyltransferase
MDSPADIQERERMVTDQIAWRGVKNPRVLAAMRSVPRHCFVPEEHRYLAYSDGPLPIGKGQTISQPYIVAFMSEALELKGEEKVLEVGTGSGYQAAVLGALAREVHTIERHASLAELARQTLAQLGIRNVQVHLGDGSQGLPEEAPFQAIMVTASAPSVPQPLLDQLDEGGRLILPVGSRGGQALELWERSGVRFKHKAVLAVAFVPLRGEYGWADDPWERG